MYTDLGKLLFGFIFFLCSSICWYFWKIVEKYKAFPSPFFDARFLFSILTGRFPKTTSFGSHAFSLAVELGKHFEEEGICFVWSGQPTLLVVGEQYTRILLNHPSAASKPLHYRVISNGLGKGLVTSLEPKWRKNRKLFNPAFKFVVLKRQVNSFNCIAKSLVNHLLEVKNRPTDDVIFIIKLHSLKNLFGALFELDVDGKQQEQKLLEALKLASRLERDTEYRLIRPWLFWKPLSFLLSKERREDHEALHNFIKNTAQEIIRSISSHGSEENESETEVHNYNSLSRILVEYYLREPSFTLPAMEEEIKTFVLAGYETVSSTLQWCLFMLALHPEVQERAFEEVKSVIGLNADDISYNDLNKLTYIECILKETLRLFVPVPCFGRFTTEEIECGKYKIPKNTSLYFIPYLLHRNPNIYPDPETFDPDRFSHKSLKHPWAFVPFSEGYRNCIGKNFSMAYMKISLAHILRKVKVTSPDTREDVKMRWTIVLGATRPIRFNITPRFHDE